MGNAATGRAEVNGANSFGQFDSNWIGRLRGGEAKPNPNEHAYQRKGFRQQPMMSSAYIFNFNFFHQLLAIVPSEEWWFPVISHLIGISGWAQLTQISRTCGDSKMWQNSRNRNKTTSQPLYYLINEFKKYPLGSLYPWCRYEFLNFISLPANPDSPQMKRIPRITVYSTASPSPQTSPRMRGCNPTQKGQAVGSLGNLKYYNIHKKNKPVSKSTTEIYGL
jgi:hypothetical protein